MMNVIFVCTGNTCRSPMAEYYLKSKNLKNVDVISRGFTGGEPVNENAVQVMAEVGIKIGSHFSKRILSYDIENADKIICMTNSHRQILISRGAKADKVYVLADEIPDPFGHSRDTYRKCRDSIFSAIDMLIKNNFFSEIEISECAFESVKAIADIEKTCFSVPWSENAIKESLEAGTHFYSAQAEKDTVGYMGLSKICDEGYVTNIAVLPEYRRRGIAKKLIEYVIDTFKNDLRFISLEVRASNQNAISLYEKLGFEKVGLRKRFYTSPTEDAVIMTKYLD